MHKILVFLLILTLLHYIINLSITQIAHNNVNIALKRRCPMYDPLIMKLFPEKKSISLNKILSSAENSDTSTQPKSLKDVSFPNIRYSLNYLDGNYDLSYMVTHYADTFFPSAFARKNLLHLQLLCSSTFHKSHYTKRTNLSSYLLAQTFWGKGILRYANKEYELFPDDVFLIDCRQNHEYFASSEEGWGYRFLHFDGIYMPGYYDQILASQNVKFTFPDASHFQELFKKLILTNYNSEQNKEILTNCILTDMITEILCQCPQYQEAKLSPMVEDLISLLQNSFCEKLTLDQIAKEMKLSKYYMSREFKKSTGKTIFGYITDCRINLAQRLLRYSKMTINEISEHIGFEDHNSFYRAFQQRETMSPSAYRKYWESF